MGSVLPRREPPHILRAQHAACSMRHAVDRQVWIYHCLLYSTETVDKVEVYFESRESFHRDPDPTWSDLNSNVPPLHHCYAHVEASRSIRLLNFGTRPPRHCYAYGLASGLARPPVPQHLSRIFIRRRLIFLAPAEQTWTRNWNRRRFCVFQKTMIR